MYNYSKIEIATMARQNGFRSETLEKVLRLMDVLDFINNNEKLSTYLVLKGGTSINLTVFNLPRLSVDIDMDFSINCIKEEMLKKRKEITSIIRMYMEINNYSFSENTKSKFALDSFVFNYINNSGNKDNLKIEINYMNRAHIYESEVRNVTISFLKKIQILTLNKYELFGSKIKALLERCTIRDVYDVYYMLKSKIFTDNEYLLIKKCVIFYMCIGKTSDRDFKQIIHDFYYKIENFYVDRIPQYLSSTLRNDDAFCMKEVIITVKEFIKRFIVLDNEELQFIEDFYKGNYNPKLLFKNEDIVNRIINHPMAVWKISEKK